MSASGVMYAMAVADTIYADHGTLVGSIGVIFGPFTFYDGVTAVDGGLLSGGVTTEGGVEVEFLTAGRSKDLGNPYRRITEAERANLQESLDQSYDEFVNRVATGREMSAAAIKRDLGAQLFGETQAVENGLIDAIADRDETYRLAAEKAGLEDGGTWAVQRLAPATPSLLDLLTGAAVDRVRGGSTPSSTATKIPTMCLGSGTILAYHGDPAELCRLNR